MAEEPYERRINAMQQRVDQLQPDATVNAAELQDTYTALVNRYAEDVDALTAADTEYLVGAHDYVADETWGTATSLLAEYADDVELAESDISSADWHTVYDSVERLNRIQLDKERREELVKHRVTLGLNHDES